MGKYDNIEESTPDSFLLKKIANELAEANRLTRLGKLNWVTKSDWADRA